MRAVLACAAIGLLFSSAECFSPPAALGLRRGGALSRVCMQDDDIKIDGKAAAREAAKAVKGVSGVFDNLRSGKGLFGTEITTKVTRQVIDKVESELAEVKEEIASVDKAAGIKKSGAAMKSAAAPVIKKPKYDEETRWEVAVALAGDGDEMDIAVRPVQKASLLLKAWAQDLGADPEDCELVVKSDSWKTGVVDISLPIGETGIMDGMVVTGVINSGKTAVVEEEEEEEEEVMKKPTYTAETKWEVTVKEAGEEGMEVAVKPTQKASLLLKAWANDVGADPEDCELVVKSDSWKTGVVDISLPIGETGIMDGMVVTVRGK